MNLLIVLLSGDAGAFSLITPNPGLSAWTLIIFIALIFILGKFAFKPIVTALKDREKSIEESLMQADKARLEMANLVAKNEQLLEQAKEERTIIIAEAREVAEKLKADIIEKAKVEAERKVQDALKEIETQKKAAIVEVKNTVGALAIDIAGKIVRKELSGSEEHKSFVEKMIKESNLN